MIDQNLFFFGNCVAYSRRQNPWSYGITGRVVVPWRSLRGFLLLGERTQTSAEVLCSSIACTIDYWAHISSRRRIFTIGREGSAGVYIQARIEGNTATRFHDNEKRPRGTREEDLESVHTDQSEVASKV